MVVVCGVQLEQRAAGGRPHTSNIIDFRFLINTKIRSITMSRKIDDVMNLYLCEVNYLMVSKDMTYTTPLEYILLFGHLVFL
jgi:hypothetical protein